MTLPRECTVIGTAVFSAMIAACGPDRSDQAASAPPRHVDDSGPAHPETAVAVAAGFCQPESGRWALTREAVGPIRLAAPIDQVRELCPYARDSMDESWGAIIVFPFPAGFVVVIPDPITQRPPARGAVGSIFVETPAIRTGGGVGVGSTLADVRGQFGPVLILAIHEYGYYALPRDSSRWLAFRLDRVPSGAVEWTEADTAVNSDVIPGTPVVIAMEIAATRK